MAKPDCDDGWLRYAHELDAALAVADFTKGARIVLHEAFEQFFGPPKLKAATLSPTEIGALVGMAKQNVGRSIKELVDANVLSHNHDGTYRFNKNYETWTWEPRGKPPKVSPRLSPAEISFCRSAPARAVARGVGSTSVGVIQTDDELGSANVIQNDDASTVVPSLGVIQTDDNLSSKLITNGSPPKNPLLGGRIRDSHTEGERAREIVVIPNDDDAEPFHAEPVPVPRPEPKPIGVNPVAECERTFQVANEFFPMTSMPTLCQQWLADHPSRKVIAAMSDAKEKARGSATRYIQKLLDDPEYGKPRPSNGQPVATRALPQQNVNPPAPKGPPVDPAETDAAIASLRSSRPEFRRKTGGPK